MTAILYNVAVIFCIKCLRSAVLVLSVRLCQILVRAVILRKNKPKKESAAKTKIKIKISKIKWTTVDFSILLN